MAAAAAAVTRDAFCVRPPTARTTAVCEVPPPAGMAPKKAPARLAAPVARSSRSALMGGSAGAAKARPAAIVSVKLINAMPSAPGKSCWTRPRLGSVIDGSDRGMNPTVATPRESRPTNHESPIPALTTTSGAGEWGQSRSIANSASIAAMAMARVSSDVFGQMVRHAQNVAEEAFLRDVHAEQLRHLIEHDHEADAGLEAGQNGRRNEIGDEPEAKHGGRDQQGPGQRGERRSRRDQLARITVGNRKPELCPGEDCKGGRRTHAQDTRCAKQRVDDHRHEGRVKPDTHRQARNRRVRHRLGQDDGRSRQACDHVEALDCNNRRYCHAASPTTIRTIAGTERTKSSVGASGPVLGRRSPRAQWPTTRGRDCPGFP